MNGMTAGPENLPLTAVLSVTEGAPGHDHAVELTVRAQEVAGFEGTAAAGLDRKLADELAADPSVGASLDRTTPVRQRAAMGERLAAAVLQGEVAEMWGRLAQLTAAGHRLRLRLDVQPSRLRALPWELLRASGEWVFLQRHTSAWRGPEPLPRPAQADSGPLRVLLVVCNPLDWRVLADEELATITSGLASQLGRAVVEIIDGPARDKLSAAIDRLRPHVLHFIGHGMPRLGEHDAELTFNWVPREQPGQVSGALSWGLVSADVAQLADWQPRLVVINACRTSGDPADPIGGFADAFLAAGTCAVVSMQADIESPAAVRFATELYQGLGGFAPLDEVVARARLRLRRDAGDTGEWALPVLAARADPADVLRLSFAHTRSITLVSGRLEYGQLREFLDRYPERREAWWALDPQPEQAPPSPVLVVSGRPVDGSPPGKTWFTRWCLLTCFLRGYRVTYVDLAEPSRQQGQGRRTRHKDWLGVLRAIRDACLSDRQLEPLPPEAFDQFNRSLNALVAGRPRTNRYSAGGPGPVPDEGLPFDYERRGFQERTEQAWSEFRAALQLASAERPHIIALDGADSILDGAFPDVYQGLIQPVAEDMRSKVRLVLVASDDWLGKWLPRENRELWTSVHLAGFEPDQFMRLARDYCYRRGLDINKALALYQEREKIYSHLGIVPLDAFRDAIKGIPAQFLAAPR